MSPPTGRSRVPARVHLAGNPSDGYRGAVLSTVVPELGASATAVAADEVTIGGRRWASVAALAGSSWAEHLGEGDRLVAAAVVALHRRLPADVVRSPVALSWSTTVPRSVGLAGSSAIVLAAMRACLARWATTMPPLALARAALAAEVDELGIAAGIADRVAQVWGGTVLTDCRSAEPDGGISVVPIAVTPGLGPFVLAWNAAAAAPSGEYHRRLRARVDRGELAPEMAALAACADRAAAAVVAGDNAGLAEAMDRSLHLRQALGPVPAGAIEPVADLRREGAAVNFAGSGGSLVITGAGAPPGWESLSIELAGPGVSAVAGDS